MSRWRCVLGKKTATLGCIPNHNLKWMWKHMGMLSSSERWGDWTHRTEVTTPEVALQWLFISLLYDFLGLGGASGWLSFLHSVCPGTFWPKEVSFFVHVGKLSRRRCLKIHETTSPLAAGENSISAALGGPQRNCWALCWYLKEMALGSLQIDTRASDPRLLNCRLIFGTATVLLFVVDGYYLAVDQ